MVETFKAYTPGRCTLMLFRYHFTAYHSEANRSSPPAFLEHVKKVLIKLHNGKIPFYRIFTCFSAMHFRFECMLSPISTAISLLASPHAAAPPSGFFIKYSNGWWLFELSGMRELDIAQSKPRDMLLMEKNNWYHYYRDTIFDFAILTLHFVWNRDNFAVSN